MCWRCRQPLSSSGDPLASGTWSKTSGAVLAPTALGTDENNAIGEPEVFIPDPAGVAQMRMFYGGGWDAGRLFAATSDDGGLTWTRANGGVPLVGGGNGGESGEATHVGVVKTPTGEIHAIYAPHSDTTTGNLSAVKSTDGGLTFGTKRTILTPSGWESGVWGNSAVVIDDAGTWHLLYEGQDTTTNLWQIGYATSPDGATWTRQNSGNPLVTLQVGTGMYGGPNLHRLPDGTWELFYHAATSGLLPTDIYRAISTDLITWERHPGARAVTRTESFEVDQVADPCVVTIGTDRVMFYSGADNADATGKVGRATYVPPTG